MSETRPVSESAEASRKTLKQTKASSKVKYRDGLNPEAKARYQFKLDALGLKTCPYELPKSSWKENPREWPPVEYPDICNYFLEYPGQFTREKLKSYKSLEAYNYLRSGWVQTMHHMKINDQKTLFIARVSHSQSLNETPLRPWVAVSNDGAIITCHCTCIAGLGELCSHVAAVLFKIEGCVRLGLNQDESCTSKACEWNKAYSKKIEPAPIDQIDFEKPSTKRKHLDKGNDKQVAKKQSKPHPTPVPEPTEAETEHFFNLLKKSEHPIAILSIFPEQQELVAATPSVVSEVTLPEPLRNLYIEANTKLEGKELNDLVENTFKSSTVRWNKEQTEYLEKITRAQSNCLHWFEYRSGRITGTKIYDVLHTNRNQPSASLIKSICNPLATSNLHSQPLKWGRSHEATAIKSYIEYAEQRHQNLQLQSIGFKINPEIPFYLGCSPDGYVSCDCHGTGLVEVKCPYKYRDIMPTDVKSDPQYCLEIKENDVRIKDTHRYAEQVQFNMYVCNENYCDFVVWTLKGMVVCRILRKQNYFENKVSLIEEFYKRHIVPELLTRRFELTEE